MEKCKLSKLALEMAEYYEKLGEQENNFGKSEIEKMKFDILNYMKMPIY